MFLIFLIVCACLFMSVKPTKKYNLLWADKPNADVIKGFFLLLVFLSHISGYYKFNTSYDLPYNVIRSLMGQTVVVAFLFFSGFGIMESIKNKEHYMDDFITQRIIKLFVHFDIAVTMFLIVNWMLGKHIGIKKYVMALTTWGGIGNSNWYVTCIICCYLFSFVCYRSMPDKKFNTGSLILLTSLCLNYMLLLSKYRPYYCYDTILCYALGSAFSIYRERITAYLSDFKRWCLVFGGAMFFCLIAVKYYRVLLIRVGYELSFCLVIVLLMMHLELRNNLPSRFLKYIGINLFGLYILQRIPMMALKDINCIENKYIYVIVCFIITLVLNYGYKQLLKRVDATFWQNNMNN